MWNIFVTRLYNHKLNAWPSHADANNQLIASIGMGMRVSIRTGTALVPMPKNGCLESGLPGCLVEESTGLLTLETSQPPSLTASPSNDSQETRHLKLPVVGSWAREEETPWYWCPGVPGLLKVTPTVGMSQSGLTISYQTYPNSPRSRTQLGPSVPFWWLLDCWLLDPALTAWGLKLDPGLSGPVWKSADCQICPWQPLVWNLLGAGGSTRSGHSLPLPNFQD